MEDTQTLWWIKSLFYRQFGLIQTITNCIFQIVEAPLKTKNSYRAVSISPQATEVLREQKRKTNDQYVFPSPNGGPISPDSVNNMLKRVLERAGIPKVRFHDLRHPYVKHTTKNICKSRNLRPPNYR
ncbi:MAG: tyrosine-type recombinase/integrase [Oscillospiraceae bacterium]|nr:tyrosine-type recombinase/integrase [Oscillospiraceae bacterium]